MSQLIGRVDLIRHAGNLPTTVKAFACPALVAGKKNGRAAKRGQFNREETPEGLTNLFGALSVAIEKAHFMSACADRAFKDEKIGDVIADQAFKGLKLTLQP